MLPIAAGRYFRPGVEVRATSHRRTVYTSVTLDRDTEIALPIGRVVGATDHDHVTTMMIEVIDRLETVNWDGSASGLVATSGKDLVDDLAYVMTFVWNRIVNRDRGKVTRLLAPATPGSTRGNAGSLIPGLFAVWQFASQTQIQDLRRFLDDLLGLPRDDFARVMRAVRTSVEAACRAIDDPTGAYTDLVAALESLADPSLASPVTWDRYDPKKAKIIDRALDGVEPDIVERVHAAVLEADMAGLKRRFVASTLARVSDDYFRGDASEATRPPRQPDLERMLSIAYDVRSRRSHVLQDLGEEAWAFTDGAETAFDPRLQHILTLAGLWRLVRHVVRRYVATTSKVEPEPWDYRPALPGIVTLRAAPQYWVWRPENLHENTALAILDGVIEAFIGIHTGDNAEGLNLVQVCERIEELVPTMQDSDAKTALIAIHTLWHRWTDPNDSTEEALRFLDAHEAVLDHPSAIAFAVAACSDRELPDWTTEQWAQLAESRHRARVTGKDSPLPPGLDALLQVNAAVRCADGGFPARAAEFAANALGEVPGNAQLVDWEQKLKAGDGYNSFDATLFMLGDTGNEDRTSGETEANGEVNAADPPHERD